MPSGSSPEVDHSILFPVAVMVRLADCPLYIVNDEAEEITGLVSFCSSGLVGLGSD